MDNETIFQRYLVAGAIQRNADAVAGLFTEDGVLESPLVPEGHTFPRLLEGRDAIRHGLGAYYRLPRPPSGTVDPARSRLVLHHPADDVLIAELDSVFTDAPPVSLVQIFRFRDDHITHLRDYFHPGVLDA